MKPFLILLCVAFAVARFTLPSHGLHMEDTFKDAAHLFVGGLFGAAIASHSQACDPLEHFADTKVWKEDLWLMAVGLTAAEVVAALIRG